MQFWSYITTAFAWEGWNGLSAIFFGFTAFFMYKGNMKTQKSLDYQSKIALFDKRILFQEEMEMCFDEIIECIMIYILDDKNQLNLISNDVKVLIKNVPEVDRYILPVVKKNVINVNNFEDTDLKTNLYIVERSLLEKTERLKYKIFQLFPDATSNLILHELRKINSIVSVLHFYPNNIKEKFRLLERLVNDKKDVAEITKIYKTFVNSYKKLVDAINDTGASLIIDVDGSRIYKSSNSKFLKCRNNINDLLSREIKFL